MYYILATVKKVRRGLSKIYLTYKSSLAVNDEILQFKKKIEVTPPQIIIFLHPEMKMKIYFTNLFGNLFSLYLRIYLFFS